VTRLAAKLKMFRRGHYTSSDSRTMRPSKLLFTQRVT
jgi:hypothetical protein